MWPRAPTETSLKYPGAISAMTFLRMHAAMIAGQPVSRKWPSPGMLLAAQLTDRDFLQTTAGASATWRLYGSG